MFLTLQPTIDNSWNQIQVVVKPVWKFDAGWLFGTHGLCIADNHAGTGLNRVMKILGIKLFSFTELGL